MRASVLQFPNNPLALGEWFLLSVAIVVVVTLVYIFVLNKTPKTEGQTVAKLEEAQASAQVESDPEPLLAGASRTFEEGNLADSVESSVRAVSLALVDVLATSGISGVFSSMSISDLAYLVQTKAKSSSPQITQPLYQLNTLRLKAIQGQPVTQQEASWAIAVANWLVREVKTGKIKV